MLNIICYANKDRIYILFTALSSHQMDNSYYAIKPALTLVKTRILCIRQCNFRSLVLALRVAAKIAYTDVSICFWHPLTFQLLVNPIDDLRKISFWFWQNFVTSWRLHRLSKHVLFSLISLNRLRTTEVSPTRFH